MIMCSVLATSGRIGFRAVNALMIFSCFSAVALAQQPSSSIAE